MAITSTMKMGAEGIKINIAGRVNGAEIARSESYKEGRIPLHTFRADIDYSIVEAHTTYGRIGIKCWICRGEVYGKRDLSPLPAPKKPTNDRRPAPGADRRPPRRRTRN
jgi:small subunit ribosomal protein S3